MNDSIIERLENIFPTTVSSKEYKDNIFMITLPEGGMIADAQVEAFDGFGITGDVFSHQNVVFYAKVVGLEDKKAPSRNWGKDFLGEKIYKRKNEKTTKCESLKDSILAEL